MECCFIGCTENAEWEIKYSNAPDDYGYSCSKHLGEIVDANKTNTVYVIGE